MNNELKFFLQGHLISNHYCFMTLTFYSFILGKTILRSSKLDDIETRNQQKKDSIGCFTNYFSSHTQKYIKTRMRPQIGHGPILRKQKKNVFLP